MKKSIVALLFLLFTGIAFSQTTVTLQDQCNCEVLKGTDVSSSGSITPAGADLGDIYVNTDTGTIYFWDGDSWELTSTDDQQLTAFTFNDATNTLSLTLENGGSVNVDLSSLSDVFTDTNTTITSFGIDGANTNLVITDSEANTYAVALADLAVLIDTNTDDQALSLASGNILTLEDGGTVDLTPFLDNTDDQAITAFSLDNTSNELTLTLEDGGTQTVDFSTVLAAAGTDDQNLTLTGDNLSIEDGNSVDLSGYMDNTDDQALSLATGNILTLEDGGTVDLTPFLDNTDNQDASEVDLGTSVDVNGDGTSESTVEDAIQAMSPIVSKAARIFYPPSIAIDASTNGTGRTINLYSQYLAQYGSPSVRSAGAPAAIPTYSATELYYYVTYADPTVFDNMSIDANGVLTYDIIGQPADYNALINVVFVVK